MQDRNAIVVVEYSEKFASYVQIDTYEAGNMFDAFIAVDKSAYKQTCLYALRKYEKRMALYDDCYYNSSTCNDGTLPVGVSTVIAEYYALPIFGSAYSVAIVSEETLKEVIGDNVESVNTVTPAQMDVIRDGAYWWYERE